MLLPKGGEVLSRLTTSANTVDDGGMLPEDTTTSTTTAIQVELRNSTACGVFNPYPVFRPSETDHLMIPRGYPMDKVHAAECQTMPRYRKHSIILPSYQIGIYQSIINNHPDLYQYHRMMYHRAPIRFQGAYEEDHPVLVPPDTMAPMNAQARLVARNAMWSLLLPFTVSDQVCDIWRSYIMQALAKRLFLPVAFVGPLVSQEVINTNHTNWNDLYAEQPLYEKSSKLVSFLLHEWVMPTDATLEGAWEQLYVELYQKGFIEWQDVELAQLWISSLQSVGYEFPTFPLAPSQHSLIASDENSSNSQNKWKWTRKPFDNVVLVGQFNFNTNVGLVTHWVKRWQEIFKYVDVRGPFDNATLASLRHAGINAFVIEDDRGWMSPMTTMADSLLLYANHSSEIQGVIMAHDDLLFNVSALVELGFPGDAVMGTIDPNFLLKPYFVVYGNSTLRLENSSSLVPVSQWRDVLDYWRWWKVLIRKLVRATNAAALEQWKYMAADGGIASYHNSQADFLYVPIARKEVIEEFAILAEWMSRNKFMLEVGTPSILGRLKHGFNISFTEVPICTDWTMDRDNVSKWIPACVSTWFDSQYGMYHPVKMFNLGLEKWNALFDSLVLGIGNVKDIFEESSTNNVTEIQTVPHVYIA
jgi:hypothetical protein